jgi:tetratricopeptide (TPR) repeat protein
LRWNSNIKSSEVTPGFLIDLEQRAIELKNAGKLKEASTIFRQIVEQQPDWEHGTAWYNLGECYENLHEYESAEQCYRKALAYEPANPYFLGGLGAFLCRRSDFNRAFDVHLRLLQVEHSSGNENATSRTVVALKSIGKNLGLSQEEIEAQIRAKISSPREDSNRRAARNHPPLVNPSTLHRHNWPRVSQLPLEEHGTVVSHGNHTARSWCCSSRNGKWGMGNAVKSKRLRFASRYWQAAT